MAPLALPTVLALTVVLTNCASPRGSVAPAPAPADAGQGAPAASLTEDQRAAIQVVERFFDGMRMRDTALMRSVTDSNARLMGTVMRNGVPVVSPPIPMTNFIANVGRATGEAWNERIVDPEARVSDNLATVWTKYTFHVGERFSHCGVDSFQLARFPAGWKIIHVADTRRTEGCPTPAPADR